MSTIIPFEFESDASVKQVFSEVGSCLEKNGLRIADSDDGRPWGGFFVIDEADTRKFIEIFFPDLNPDDFSGFEKLSPKILMVAPGERLSWQYHHRRAEIWRVIGGKIAVITSMTDHPRNKVVCSPGKMIELQRGERHRLIGTGQWGVVAEIWKHLFAEQPSDEQDIVRLEDDYGRSDG